MLGTVQNHHPPYRNEPRNSGVRRYALPSTNTTVYYLPGSTDWG
jgi:hypothetical protein